jgi:hypothetical protein
VELTAFGRRGREQHGAGAQGEQGTHGSCEGSGGA